MLRKIYDKNKTSFLAIVVFRKPMPFFNRFLVLCTHSLSHTHTYTHTYLHAQILTRTHIHIHTHTHTHSLHAHTYTFTHTHSLHAHTYTFTHTHSLHTKLIDLFSRAWFYVQNKLNTSATNLILFKLKNHILPIKS